MVLHSTKNRWERKPKSARTACPQESVSILAGERRVRHRHIERPHPLHQRMGASVSIVKVRNLR